MIRIKNLFEAPEATDNLRLWVGPVGLTRDLATWCRVDGWLREGSPSPELSEWFEEHPGGWQYFRGKHHEQLDRSNAAETLRALSRRAMKETVTLLHAESDPSENSAVSLYEYLVELQAYCSDEQSDAI